MGEAGQLLAVSAPRFLTVFNLASMHNLNSRTYLRHLRSLLELSVRNEANCLKGRYFAKPQRGAGEWPNPACLEIQYRIATTDWSSRLFVHLQKQLI